MRSEVADGARLVICTEGLKVGADDGPLRALEKGVDVGCFVATILLQVGVLPQINADDGDALHVNNAVHQRIILIVCLGDQEAPISADSEPDPAGKGAAHHCFKECFLEAVKTGKVL